VKTEGVSTLGVFRNSKVVHNSIDIAIIDDQSNAELDFPYQNTKNIGMIARVDRSKDHSTLLTAFNRVSSPCNLHLVGDGTDDVEFIKYSKHLCNIRKDDIVFWGEMQSAISIIKNLDALVICSNFEAFPNVLVEAISANIPVIATAVGGIPEICRYGCEIELFQPGDFDTLTLLIDKQLQQPTLITNGAEIVDSLYLNFKQSILTVYKVEP
jgi:glycosyltransferase involved in cell wall biosynthesis